MIATADFILVKSSQGHTKRENQQKVYVTHIFLNALSSNVTTLH